MIKSLSAALLLSASLIGYAATNANTSASQVIQLKSNQQTVQVNLPANATTGYQWFVQSYDHDLLSLQDYRYASPTTKLVGAGGTAVFVFNVDPRFYDAPQVTNITFVYQQPWSPGQNTNSATVTLSSTASNNDSMNWQKYPVSPDNVLMPNSSTDNTDANNWVSLPAGASSATNS